MASFLKSLLGSVMPGGRGSSAAAEEPVEYNGYRLYPTPFRDEGQYRTAGRIEKEFETGMKEHRFIRAEKHASLEEAQDFSLIKARQIVDQNGDRMFS
jgi:hypothetical protein